MDKLTNIDVLWLETSGARPVGLVRAYDTLEKRWKYYIGTGWGLNPQEDALYIIANGQKYYSLAFLASFERSDTP